MQATSPRTAVLIDNRELLSDAGHSAGQVVELGPRRFGPSCGCGYSGVVVGTEPAALDSLLRHLAAALEMLTGNGLGNHAGNVQHRRAKMRNIHAGISA